MFEQIVRQSQKPRVTPTRRIISTREVVEVEPAGASWGKIGSLPQAIEVPPEEDPIGISFTLKKDKTHDSEKLETEKVKIVNPSDEGQYVITERIKSVKYKANKPDAVAVWEPSGIALQAGSSQPSLTYHPDGTVEPLENPSGAGRTYVTPPQGWTWENSVSNPQNPEYKPAKVDSNTYSVTWPTSPNERPI